MSSDNQVQLHLVFVQLLAKRPLNTANLVLDRFVFILDVFAVQYRALVATAILAMVFVGFTVLVERGHAHRAPVPLVVIPALKVVEVLVDSSENLLLFGRLGVGPVPLVAVSLDRKSVV